MHDTVDRLSEGLLTGDDQALEREFEARLVENATLAWRVAYSVVRQWQDAEDVAQEAFLRAHRAFRRLRDRSRFRSWLVRTTWRLALDLRRGEKRREAREQVAAAPPIVDAPSSEESFIAEERSRRLWQAIDGLPEKLRIVVVLTLVEDYDVQELADLLGLPAGTVKWRLFSARQKLKERLG